MTFHPLTLDAFFTWFCWLLGAGLGLAWFGFLAWLAMFGHRPSRWS